MRLPSPEGGEISADARRPHRRRRARPDHLHLVLAVCDYETYHSATITIRLESLPIVRSKAGERVPPIKTQARSATILPNFVGLIFQVHNGKIYNDVRITEDMVGHKLGEFSAYVIPNRASRQLADEMASTRKRFAYKQTKNK
ncbi:mitochondrial ribosomal small subunit component [Friedmanniomyces endolithicus]|uniref:Mitochondrial ribosomal small subunit component n=1 Tax=Friedmanniomyces endolithicus TaxID=329885 RepID=A0AAN6J6T9_9PEZI|nr:mitochondrial ribosomal small subunit component [Friedmanniomyces endolithicus]KAK0290019.1 mitochondrial ribosomal small subunit component [Friedmanniomyces endolithicus]KAK0318415.1 mitochondrial ribosomal small subunit component [Friedmanniomyces endolithicus]KAK1017233.1 mitochondrial ribosomal small subunit component [Friedmanniomyces endolithicus]